ncbi:hypothetical protein DCAR_0416188 [Daucus carota subsp. sativus]|uniref:RNase H type-1 domain-containing protein n=1 Tax=Daucus carota subsp. sativus TaxID=79200 RepID=A0A164W644_DAUCS|nr:hypothetical protein DCAR_0416188 [Daucus carota subsp. sativus]
MEYFWEVADKDYIKINVHCVVSEVPLPNGNTLAVAAIIRDDNGDMLWGVLGVLPGLNEEQAILAAVQAACIHANEKELHKIHIETDNERVYDTLRLQEQILLEEEQLDAYRAFNTLHANNYKVGTTKKSILHVPLHMNSSAEYMARYALENLKVFVETSKPFGNLDFFLQRDMGKVLPHPIYEFLGDGEVIDGPPPPPVKKRRLSPFQNLHFGHSLDFSGSSVFDGFSPFQGLERCVRLAKKQEGWEREKQRKGKGKLLEDYSFNKNGLLSKEAISLLNDQKLSALDSIFRGSEVDMESVVFGGVAVKEILHKALTGSLADLLPLWSISRTELEQASGIVDFIAVYNVMKVMGFGNQEAEFRYNASQPSTSSQHFD